LSSSRVVWLLCRAFVLTLTGTAVVERRNGRVAIELPSPFQSVLFCNFNQLYKARLVISMGMSS
jgi:hypothetical protein